MRISAILSALVLLSGLTACDRHREGDGNGGEQKKMALKLPEGTPQKPTGASALDVSDKDQAFSVASVSAYFLAHNLPMNMGAASDIHVDNVEILTDGELSQRLGGVSTGLGVDAKVALASLSGLFVFTGPPHGKIARFRTAYAVFAVETGNLMLAGTTDAKTGGSDAPR